MSLAEPASSISACLPSRIAISGIGMVTPGGPDRESSWQSLISGRSCLRWLTDEEHRLIGCDLARTRLAGAPAALGRLSDRFFDTFPGSFNDPSPIQLVSDRSLSSRATLVHRSQIAHFNQMLFQAADEAAVHAGLVTHSTNLMCTAAGIDKQRVGLVIGSSKGNLSAIRNSYLANVQERLTGSADTYQPQVTAPMWPDCWASSPASHLAARWDVCGPVLAPVAACATGMASLCRGAELIRDDVCDIVFAGSVDDSLSEIVWGSYRRLGVLARIPNDDPATACRPFDRDRSGFLMGSGSAVIVLERWEAAVARGHHPYAEWLVGGILSDATALTQVSSDAAGLTRLIQDLLRRGDLAARDLDYINLHGTGTRDNDRYETLGVRQALGASVNQVSCSSLKGTFGHLLGAAGSVEFAATVLALRDGIIPPTCNLENSSPECDLDYTPKVARRKDMKTALKLSLGFGGHLVGGLIRRP
jgi:3-oxoacyl-[acyl-carrier-protein] synthase II